MNLLPKASGSRPRLACEIAASGVVAARSPEPEMPLAAASRVVLQQGAVLPGLKPSNVVDRVAVIAAVRRALEQVGARPNARNVDLTLVVPDSAVRVLLLDFDALPNKLSEALPIVRFRLKKLLPFEADEAMISFQVMSTSRSLVRVLAVAIPRDVLGEYESVVREAGFEPGAVLPSTLAALASLNEGEGASLVVNAQPSGVTTGIVRAGIVLLHHTVDLLEHAPAHPADLPAALFEPSSLSAGPVLVGRASTAGAQPAEAVQPAIFGQSGYADSLAAVAVVQNEDGDTWIGADGGAGEDLYRRRAEVFSSSASEGFYDRGEPAPVQQSPYVGPTVEADLDPALHHAILDAPTAVGTFTDPGYVSGAANGFGASGLDQGPRAGEDDEQPVHVLAPDQQTEEIARAVSVAVAYFEDSLGAAPPVLLSAGPMGAEGLNRLLHESGVAQEDGLRVRELIDAAAIGGVATTASVSRGHLAGVVGALRS